MRAQVLTGIGKMEMREVEKPSIKRDDDVLLNCLLYTSPSPRDRS